MLSLRVIILFTLISNISSRETTSFPLAKPLPIPNLLDDVGPGWRIGESTFLWNLRCRCTNCARWVAKALLHNLMEDRKQIIKKAVCPHVNPKGYCVCYTRNAKWNTPEVGCTRFEFNHCPRSLV